jgi:hypothetical protein
MKFFLLLSIIAFFSITSNAQPCLQPGALVSVFNTAKGKHEYLVFKFMLPYQSKGILTGGSSGFFNPVNNEGKTYHKISFTNVTNFCPDKWLLNLPQKKILDFKTPEMGNGTVSYVFELAPGAKIHSHYSYRQQNYLFVKIRID